MKLQIKRLPFIGAALAVCAVFLGLTACAPAFDGSAIKDPDAYALEIRAMTGTDLHTLELKEGDVLQVQFETVKGSLSLEIQAPDGTAVYRGNGKETTEFTLDIPQDGVYVICVEAKRAKGSIRVDAERVSAPEVPEPVTAEDLAGPWRLAVGENDEAAVNGAFPGAMEFGSGMELTGDGHLSWYIGADGGSGTYTLDGAVVSAGMTSDFDGTAMNMEFTVEEQDGRLLLAMEYKGLTLRWVRGEAETGRGGYPGQGQG